MKLLSLLFGLLLIGGVAAQDSVMVPGWQTKQPGFELRVLSDTKGEDFGIYGKVSTASLDSRAADSGTICVQYEKLVWRKRNAKLADINLFNRDQTQFSAFLDQLNIGDYDTTSFGLYLFETPNPRIFGSWSQLIDSDNTLYYIYEACKAL